MGHFFFSFFLFSTHRKKANGPTGSANRRGLGSKKQLLIGAMVAPRNHCTCCCRGLEVVEGGCSRRTRKKDRETVLELPESRCAIALLPGSTHVRANHHVSSPHRSL